MPRTFPAVEVVMVGLVRSRAWQALALGVLAVAGTTTIPAAGAAAAPSDWKGTRLTTEHSYRDVDATTDRWGRVHMVSTRAGSGGGVVYLRPRPDGTWGEQRISRDVSSGSVAIVLDARGKPAIGWVAGRRIRVATQSAGDWTIDTIDARSVDGSPIDLAVGADGGVHVAWLAGRDSERLRLTSREPTGWRTRVIGPATSYEPVTLGVSPDGAVHIAYTRARWFGGRDEAWYARVHEGSVSLRLMGRGSGARLDMDAVGRPVVAWNPMRRDDLAIATRDGGGWKVRQVGFDGFWDMQGFTLHRGRPVAVGLASLPDANESRQLVVTVRDDGSLQQQSIADWYTCELHGLVSMVGGVLGMPCLAARAQSRGTEPGVNILLLDGSVQRVLPVATEERYRAIWATAPDGSVEIVTERTNGDLALHIRDAEAWLARRLPPLPRFGVEDLAIGRRGERAIVGSDWSGRIVLLTDRSGRWETSRLGRGYSPQVSIDAAGDLHIGWVRSRGTIAADLRLAVGTPGSWRTWTVPRSRTSEGYDDWPNRPFFFVRPSGQDIVVWHRRSGRQSTHGVLLRTRDHGGWRSTRISKEWFETLWSADLASDGTLGLVRGEVSSSLLTRIRRDGQIRNQRIPYGTFFGADLTFAQDGRAGFLATGFDARTLQLIYRGPQGWSRSRVLDGSWASARLAFEENRPLLLVRRGGAGSSAAGFYLVSER